jgi:hypothetical protein
MARLRDIWRRWTATRYTRLLETEVARLRAENRALLNSILGIAGIPPVTVAMPSGSESEQQPVHASSARPEQKRTTPPFLGRSARASQLRNAAGSARCVGPPGAGPVRRRSWHQVNRALEIDSARKKEKETAGGLELGLAVKKQ